MVLLVFSKYIASYYAQSGIRSNALYFGGINNNHNKICKQIDQTNTNGKNGK